MTVNSGEMMNDERLAVTLERVAADPDAFYTGDLADDIGEQIDHLRAPVSNFECQFQRRI